MLLGGFRLGGLEGFEGWVGALGFRDSEFYWGLGFKVKGFMVSGLHFFFLGGGFRFKVKPEAARPVH